MFINLIVFKSFFFANNNKNKNLEYLRFFFIFSLESFFYGWIIIITLFLFCVRWLIWSILQLDHLCFPNQSSLQSHLHSFQVGVQSTPCLWLWMGSFLWVFEVKMKTEERERGNRLSQRHHCHNLDLQQNLRCLIEHFY